MRHSWIQIAGAAVLAVATTATASAQTSTGDLRRMSLEEVLSIRVTTASREPEQGSLVSAAITVITGDDIRRAGARSIPEALRLAPGVQVSRIDGGTWAIGMRGLADRLARAMLVLIDGRAVYSPLFAGTYWEVQDTLLEDVDRIEVIRGPGGTLWGANAVTGIINIITKSARRTAGTVVIGGAGTTERGALGVRYGGSAGGNWDYRIYGKAFSRAHEFHATNLNYDGLRMGQGGFRADWTPPSGGSATVQGDIYRATLGERPSVTSFAPPYVSEANDEAPLSGGNVLARWKSTPGDAPGVQIQTFYTRTNRDERPVSESRDTFDLDFQHSFSAARRQHVVWGLGYRASSGRITAILPARFLPDTRTDSLYSAFIQDDIGLVENRLRLTLGSKIEHNSYSGVEVQPSARIAWTPAPDEILWASVTRAVRTPSRVETDYTTSSLLNPAIPLFVQLRPNQAFEPEKLIAFETGYRVRPASMVHVTFSGFFNVLEDVLSSEILAPEPDPPSAPARLVIPVMFGNGLDGSSYGAEATADVRPTDWWRLSASYSYVRIALTPKPESLDGSHEARNEGLSPRHQAQVDSSFDLPGGWTFDAFVRHVSKLDFGPIPAYTTSNLRLAWQMTPQLELEVVGQDLNQAHHVEWASRYGNVGVRRSGYLQFTWRR